MLEFLEKTILVTGHYGSGKTNLSVNLAIDLKKQGRQVVLVDLDIVNPYFRTADFKDLMQQKGIELFASPYANSNLDLPILTAQLGARLGGGDTVIVDVGGDDSGATALGGYAPRILQNPYSMLYVINSYRYMTRQATEATGLMKAIEKSSRLRVTHLVNNSHLSHLTTKEDVERSLPYANLVAEQTGKPLAFTAAKRDVAKELAHLTDIYPVDIYVKAPW